MMGASAIRKASICHLGCNLVRPRQRPVDVRRSANVPQGRCASGLALIEPNVGTGLDSTDDGRQVFFEIDQVVLAEQDRRAAALSGYDHQDLVEVYEDFP